MLFLNRYFLQARRNNALTFTGNVILLSTLPVLSSQRPVILSLLSCEKARSLTFYADFLFFLKIFR